MNPISIAWNWIALAGLFFRELLLSVYDVALNVIRPSRVQYSAIIAVPLDVESDLGIVTFANMITLTPGTISLHIAKDRSAVYVHVMNYSPTTVASLKSGFERRVLKVLR